MMDKKKTVRNVADPHRSGSSSSSKGEYKRSEDEQWSLSLTSPPSTTREWLLHNGFQQFVETFSHYSGLDMFRLSKTDFKEICGITGITLFEALRRPQSCVLRLYIKADERKCYRAVFLQKFSYDDFVLKLSEILNCTPDSIQQITMEHSTGIHILVTSEVIANMEDESIFILDTEKETPSTNAEFDTATHSDYYTNDENNEDELGENGRKQPTRLTVKLRSSEELSPEK
ncbi:transcription factor CP2-like [Macrobrachium nipponense]|uniref:transcription factor CP2-like n=1 Tax=Macrobrachium nipponense TaxID=159736 RepID=UPI0030C7D27C